MEVLIDNLYTMENQTPVKNKNLWIGAGALIIILIVIFAVRSNKFHMYGTADINNPDALEVTEDTSAGSVNTTPTTTKAVRLKYADALVTYKDRRIQIDDICRLNPDTVAYKNNTNVMIDNRSKESKTLKIADRTIIIKGYGFKIVNISATKFPSNILVECDTHHNVATITVQK